MLFSVAGHAGCDAAQGISTQAAAAEKQYYRNLAIKTGAYSKIHPTWATTWDGHRAVQGLKVI